jgi:hypothetical protein
MTHYFFHLDECGSFTKDLEGQELVDLEAARATAIVAARDVMGGELAHGTICLSCFIDITDAAGRLMIRVPFADAVRVTGL